MSDEKYVAALEAIYDAALDPELWPAALEAITAFFGGRIANLFYLAEDGSFRMIVSTNCPLNVLDGYHTHWWQFDIRSERAIEQDYFHWRGAQTDLDLVTEQEIAASPFYQVFLRSNDLGWIVAMGVSPVPAARVALTVQFSAAYAKVTDEDRNRLERVASHVEGALRLSLRLQESEVIRNGLANALNRLDIGVMLLDGAGLLTFANPVAIEMFGESGTPIGERPRLGSGNVQKLVQSALNGLAENLSQSDASPPILLPDADGLTKAALYILPVGTAAGTMDNLFSDTSYVLLAIGMQSGVPADPALVRDLLGLTLGEARVAALVGSGMTPKAAAEKLGITIDTVRTVLKTIFSKVGVNKQSELTALLTRLVLR